MNIVRRVAGHITISFSIASIYFHIFLPIPSGFRLKERKICLRKHASRCEASWRRFAKFLCGSPINNAILFLL
ncbi:MAG: hypothetical protein LBJ67_09510 [Planctomycetaceae bacterium]|nr:hypothetical protein [Planctomycetaceae bacterium]